MLTHLNMLNLPVLVFEVENFQLRWMNVICTILFDLIEFPLRFTRFHVTSSPFNPYSISTPICPPPALTPTLPPLHSAHLPWHCTCAHCSAEGRWRCMGISYIEWATGRPPVTAGRHRHVGTDDSQRMWQIGGKNCSISDRQCGHSSWDMDVGTGEPVRSDGTVIEQRFWGPAVSLASS